MAVDAEIASTIADRVLRKLALRAAGMSGADIEFVLKEARQTARYEKRNLTLADLEAAFLRRKPARSDLVRFHQACHEAGHAVAHVFLGLGSIEMITINGAEGASYVDASIDSRCELPTLDLLTKLIVVDLAGRAAEQELCGCLSTGSAGQGHSDLARATKRAFDLEMTCGFGSQYPLVYRNVTDPFALLAVNSTLAERVNQRLEEAYEGAQRIVTQQQRAIKYLAVCLLEDETLEGNSLDVALAEVKDLMIPAEANA